MVFIKKRLIVLLILFAVVTFTSCSQTSASQQEVITVNEEETAVHIDFTAADASSLKDYEGQDLSHADILRILDQEDFSNIPEEVIDRLETIQWDWNIPFEEHAGGVFEYED